MVRRRSTGLYYPNAADPDLAIIRALTRGPRLVRGQRGAGVKVAIVDSGIDVATRASAMRIPAQPQVGSPLYNNKVIARRSSTTKRHRALHTRGRRLPRNACRGTVACNFETPTIVDGVTLPYKMSGWLHARCWATTTSFRNVGSARSEDILNALEAAYADGFDIANMSLVAGQRHQDLLTVAVDNSTAPTWW